MKMIKVLIVDDEYIMRQGLKYMIDWEQEGYEIVGEATNGKEALNLVEELRPHIIICDIVMPLLDGVDFSEIIHKMYPQIQTIILSGYDNFEYVKQTLMSGAADYVLKPTLNQEELRKVLRKAAERIPGYKLQTDSGSVNYERMMERYLLGHDKELNVSVFEKYFTGSCFRIYAVNIKKENENGRDMSDVLHKKLERELQKNKNTESLFVMLREELACVIFCYEPSGNRELLQFIERIHEQLVLLCGRILGVCSRSFTKLEEVCTIYQQDIMKNVDKAFYYPERKLLFLDRKEPYSSVSPTCKFDFFQYNCLLGGKQYEAALSLLERYSKAALASQMDVYRMKNQMKNMLYHFLDCLPNTDEEKDELRHTYFKSIGQAAYESEYQSCIDKIMQELKVLSAQYRPQGDERIEKMLDYISRNYQEDLKLEDLAEEFNFNYHYLSSYFNQQMKEGFSDYLNRIRIEKACWLLKESSLSIAQISGEVGYSEHSYFCRVFKKITGKTPSVWRRSQHYE